MEELSESAPNYEIKLYNSKTYLLTLSLVFTLASVFFIWLGIINNIPGTGTLLGLMFLASLRFTIPKYLDTRPQIVINPDGITSVTWKWKTIPWDGIRAVREIRSSRQPTVLGLELKDKDKYYEQMSALQRGLYQVFTWWTGEHLYLSATVLNGTAYGLLKHIAYLKLAGKISVSLPDIEGNEYFIDSRKL